MLVLLQIILLLLNPDTLALNALLNLPPTRSSEQGRWGIDPTVVRPLHHWGLVVAKLTVLLPRSS
jgi:hypothetical protein